MAAVRVGFQYVVLRVVPRVDREEFVNVGVVVYAQAADFLSCASRVDPSRLTALFGGIDVDGVRAGLAAVAQVCATEDEPRGKRFGWLAAPRSTVLQPGPVHGGVTDDPAASLAALLDRYVPEVAP